VYIREFSGVSVHFGLEFSELEPRGQQHRRERLNEALREELITILAGELGDPRIGLVTVSEVVLAPGGKSMRVYVNVEGSEEEARQTMQGLAAAVGFIRHELAENLDLRHAPEISFHLDRSEQYGSRIDELLHRVQKRKKP
jgi:ribosome-binding factor A